MVRCPTCRTEVQPDWYWCHVCGWDPEGLRPAGWAPTGTPAAPAPPPGPPVAHPPPLAPGIGAGPGSAFAGYGQPPLPPQPVGHRRGSSGATAITVILLVAGSFVGIVVILILAVTFLGTPQETSTFASVEGAIGPGGGGALEQGADGVSDAGGAPIETDWTRFTSADGTFSIDFPVAPIVEHPPNQRPVEVIKVEVTTADVGTSEYGVVYLEYAPDFDFVMDPAEFLDMYAREVNDSIGITVTSTTPGNYAYSTSVEYVGTSRKSGLEARGVVFLNANHLFLVMTVGDPAFPPDSQRFLDSLTLG